MIKKVLLVKASKFNFLSVIQLCDVGYKVEFHSTRYLVKHELNAIMLVVYRKDNIYSINLPCVTNPFTIKCFMSKEEEAWL